jgi:nucleobase:cation symporter-1, NCS1 family
VTGTALSALAADSVLWVGPLAAALGADLSLLGGPAAALVYYLLVRGRPAFARTLDQPVTKTTEKE